MSFDPQEVLEFWFPDNGHWETMEAHGEFWNWHMQGGADDEIIARFPDLTLAAARGELDHWAETPYGRLALIVALDQFPRSLWRDTPKAYSQDIKAARLCLEGIKNGHFDALKHVWEKMFYIISIGHCEGPDHLERMDMLIEMCRVLSDDIPPQLAELKGMPEAQNVRVRGIIERFGRHPHRNPILGRISTPDEEAYIAGGDFPHLAKTPDES